MSVAKITLTHSASQNVVPEKRFALTQSVESIKQSAYSHFGTPSAYCRLELYDDRGLLIEADMSNEKMLGYYQCRDGYRIHVVDTQPAETISAFNDLSKVKKFEISEEEWLKRGDNVRAFKQQMLARQRAEMEAAGVAPTPVVTLNADSYEESAKQIQVGSRCRCKPGDRLGEVKYVGRIAKLKPGYWVGVQFDEPVGKSDGSVNGQRLFDCAPLYGAFLRPDQVEVGDFPPENLFSEDD
ncbi:unnamed protein product [Phytomonas sp. EM1]|nr:unnamed protein product [Phytomonas sp. EM1]|eukprot:CCW61241.1 unnamed protein product [Phytomonas sp. isolate EM1]